MAGLFGLVQRNKKATEIVWGLLGLPGAGKRTIKTAIKNALNEAVKENDQFQKIKDIKGQEVAARYVLSTLDMLGGDPIVPQAWSKYLCVLWALIFVVDSSELEGISLENCRHNVSLVAKDALSQNKPILFLCNKQDKPNAQSPESIESLLRINQFSNLVYRMVPCTAIIKAKAVVDMIVKGPQAIAKATAPFDPAISEGVVWLLSAIGDRYEVLKRKTIRDEAAVDALHALEKLALSGAARMDKKMASFVADASSNVLSLISKPPSEDAENDVKAIQHALQEVHETLDNAVKHVKASAIIAQLEADFQDATQRVREKEGEVKRLTQELRASEGLRLRIMELQDAVLVLHDGKDKAEARCKQLEEQAAAARQQIQLCEVDHSRALRDMRLANDASALEVQQLQRLLAEKENHAQDLGKQLEAITAEAHDSRSHDAAPPEPTLAVSSTLTPGVPAERPMTSAGSALAALQMVNQTLRLQVEREKEKETEYLRRIAEMEDALQEKAEQNKLLRSSKLDSEVEAAKVRAALLDLHAKLTRLEPFQHRFNSVEGENQHLRLCISGFEKDMQALLDTNAKYEQRIRVADPAFGGELPVSFEPVDVRIICAPEDRGAVKVIEAAVGDLECSCAFACSGDADMAIHTASLVVFALSPTFGSSPARLNMIQAACRAEGTGMLAVVIGSGSGLSVHLWQGLDGSTWRRIADAQWISLHNLPHLLEALASHLKKPLPEQQNWTEGRFDMTGDEWQKRGKNLHELIVTNDVEGVTANLQSGMDVNEVNSHGDSVLLFAAVRRLHRIANLLLASRADPNVCNASGVTPLLAAAKLQDVQMAVLLLEHGADVHALDVDSNGVLHYVCRASCPELVAILLHHGASVHARNAAGEQPLHIACRFGHGEVARMLLAAGADVNSLIDGQCPGTPLQFAAAHEDYAGVSSALFAGGKVQVDLGAYDGSTALHIAAARRDVRVVCDLCANRAANMHATNASGDTPLHIAASAGNEDAVRYLVQGGAKVNAANHWGETAMHAAVRGGSMEVMSCLHTNGAKVDCVDANGDTPLLRAALAGRADAVTHLVQLGSDLSAVNKQAFTALHLACLRNHADVVAALISAGAAADDTRCGFSPLHLAAMKGQRDAAEALLKTQRCGVDMRSVTEKRTALHLAVEQGFQDMAKMLVDWGADVMARDQYARTALDITADLNLVLELKRHSKLRDVYISPGSAVDGRQQQDDVSDSVAGFGLKLCGVLEAEHHISCCGTAATGVASIMRIQDAVSELCNPIKAAAAVIFILTPWSVASPRMRKEIELAREMRRPIFTAVVEKVALDSELAAALDEAHSTDFTRQDAFAECTKHLVLALHLHALTTRHQRLLPPPTNVSEPAIRAYSIVPLSRFVTLSFTTHTAKLAHELRHALALSNWSTFFDVTDSCSNDLTAVRQRSAAIIKCCAFVPLLTRHSQFDEVLREHVQLAEIYGKPIFPILLPHFELQHALCHPLARRPLHALLGPSSFTPTMSSLVQALDPLGRPTALKDLTRAFVAPRRMWTRVIRHIRLWNKHIALARQYQALVASKGSPHPQPQSTPILQSQPPDQERHGPNNQPPLRAPRRRVVRQTPTRTPHGSPPQEPHAPDAGLDDSVALKASQSAPPAAAAAAAAEEVQFNSSNQLQRVEGEIVRLERRLKEAVARRGRLKLNTSMDAGTSKSDAEWEASSSVARARDATVRRSDQSPDLSNIGHSGRGGCASGRSTPPARDPSWQRVEVRQRDDRQEASNETRNKVQVIRDGKPLENIGATHRRLDALVPDTGHASDDATTAIPQRVSARHELLLPDVVRLPKLPKSQTMMQASVRVDHLRKSAVMASPKTKAQDRDSVVVEDDVETLWLGDAGNATMRTAMGDHYHSLSLYDHDADTSRLSIRGSQRTQYIRRCMMAGIEPKHEVAQMLSSDPVRPPDMEYYDFSARQIGDMGLLPLLDVLRLDRNFTALNLSGNDLSNPACIAIEERLAGHQALAWVDMRNNADISTAGGRAFLALVHRTPTLQHIALNTHNMSETIVQNLQASLARNRLRGLQRK